MEKKIIDAIELDLVVRKDILKKDIPKEGNVIFTSSSKKVISFQNKNEINFFLIEDGYYSESESDEIKYQEIFLVEDFDQYYEEIKKLKQALPKKNKETSKIAYYFINTLASIIIISGIIGATYIFRFSIELGIVSLISTAIFPAILFGIAQIIYLLSK